MKRCVIIFVSVLAVVVFGTQVNAQTIDLISQTYHIYGSVFGPPLPAPIVFDITSSVPPLSAPPPPSQPSTYWDIHSDGGTSGSSLFIDIAASNQGFTYGSASADLVFLPIGASYLDLSYTLREGFGETSLTLSDLTTSVTLVSPHIGLGESTTGSVEVPVVPSDIYELSAMASCTSDFAWASATITAAPEPATMLLVASGLVWLVGCRRKFKGVNV
ncbi:MAG: PEP-CTERM sorting domain-containing protein [Syntrophorhabdales bacterium]|jgi:hypothetical protein